MKLNTRNTKKAKGMTLLELTVVILVLLSLISVLFVGARAWKRGSDRAACVMNIRNIHQAVRGHQNMTDGRAYVEDDIVGGPNAYLETAPVCPSAGSYTIAATYPAIGTAAATCSLATTHGHVPNSVAGW